MKVTLGATQVIYGVNEEQKEKMINDLCLLNPAYVNAMKYSGYSRVNIPKYLHYYTSNKDTLSTPRGYRIPFNYEIISDNRLEFFDIHYPKLYVQLRKAQEEAANAYLSNTDNGTIVVSTGLGKSILGIYLAMKLRQRALIIVQKDDLISGWKNDIMLSLRLRPKQIGVIKAKEFRIGEQLTVATIQTLSKLEPEQLKLLHSKFSMIILDEAHHAPAKSYDIVNAFPAKYRIALTATDMRNDGLRNVMTFYFGNVCYRYEDTNENTDIIPPKDVIIKVRESNIQYSPPDSYVNSYGREIFAVRTVTGDYKNIWDLDYGEIQELISSGYLKRKSLDYHKAKNKIIENETFNLQVANDVLYEVKNRKSCLVFCSEKEHCRIIRDALLSIGLSERNIQMYYGDSKESKEDMKRRAESKEVLVTIATYAIATEGTNVKAWERIFLAMTIGNEKDTIQAIGRGRRICEGKQNLIIYDYRHPGIKGIRGHGAKRDAVYHKLGFSLNKIEESKPLFQRGIKAV